MQDIRFCNVICGVSECERCSFAKNTSLHYNELNEIDEFMDELSPQIKVIWGVSDDNSLKEEAK